MPTIFSTNILLGVINSLVTQQQWFLNRYFPTASYSDTKLISFDVIDKTRRLAPFVSPVVAGKVVKSNGISTKTFEPANIKDKRIFDSARALTRSAGEPIGGNLTAMDRMKAILAYELLDQMEMIDRRLELMACEALRTGKSIITGDEYPTVEVDFGRKPELTVVLTGTARWSDPASKPLKNIRDWALLMFKSSGAMPTDVVHDIDSWKEFSEHADVKELLDRTRGNSSNEEVQFQQGGTFMGRIDGMNHFVYVDFYIDPADDTEKTFLPSGTVMLLTPKVQGVRAFGAIKDEDAGFQALSHFPKSWTEKDPSARFLMMQSAPLIVPTRVNATFSATVL